MEDKSLLIFCGRLEESSSLRTQLGIEDIFSLQLKGKSYRSQLKTLSRNVSKYYDTVWDSRLSLNPTVATVQDFLIHKVPSWRNYRNLMIYSVRLFFKDAELWRTTLEKAAFSDRVVISDCKPGFCGIPSNILESSKSTDRRILDLSDAIEMRTNGNTLDIGSVVGLFEVSRISSSERHFNEFRKESAYLIKRSTRADKAEQEHRFLSTLPAPVRPFYPQVGEYRKINGAQEYEIEFLPLFDASRLFIHAAVAPENFSSLLDKVTTYLDACPRKGVSVEQYREAMTRLFVNKLQNRFEELQQMAIWPKIRDFAEFSYSGGLPALVAELCKQLKLAIQRTKGDELIFSHGDLCLPNILYDRDRSIMKLVDPKGITCPDDAYLPWYYDLAKLSHSILGGYDLITNDCCQIDVRPDLSLKSSSHDLPDSYLIGVGEVFKKWVSSAGWDLRLMRLCEASLFLSMLPLHAVQPNHMLLQIVAGYKAMAEAKES